ncbi:MAG: ATP-binding protein [Acidimicrobiales bacterium]
MRPLDRLPSLKLKFGSVIVAAVGVSAVVSAVAARLDAPLLAAPVLAVTVALAVVHFLARGLTSPLRDMARAAAAMSAGDYGRRVQATSGDEVGRLAVAFTAMAGDLAEVDRVRRDLVANVSHELRTPISALQAVLENLVDGVEPPDPEALRTMLRQVERLGRLVRQLLDLSRLESGNVPLQRGRFEVRSLLDDAAAEVRLLGATIEIEVHVTPPGLVVVADHERLHQVVVNLLDNAVRHSPVGGRVEVAACERSGGAGLRLEVNDGGPGIGPDQAERVFERFYRADASRSPDGGGAGLGLAISRWRVDLHGGRIWPEAAHPTGCRMIVELPGGTDPNSPGRRNR